MLLVSLSQRTTSAHVQVPSMSAVPLLVSSRFRFQSLLFRLSPFPSNSSCEQFCSSPLVNIVRLLCTVLPATFPMSRVLRPDVVRPNSLPSFLASKRLSKLRRLSPQPSPPPCPSFQVELLRYHLVLHGIWVIYHLGPSILERDPSTYPGTFQDPGRCALSPLLAIKSEPRRSPAPSFLLTH